LQSIAFLIFIFTFIPGYPPIIKFLNIRANGTHFTCLFGAVTAKPFHFKNGAGNVWAIQANSIFKPNQLNLKLKL
jgi:hypothetical protein